MLVTPRSYMSPGQRRYQRNGRLAPDLQKLRAETLKQLRLGERAIREFEPPSPHVDRLQSRIRKQRIAVLAPNDRRWPTAIHEAAHCVAAVLNDVKFSTASVVPTNSTLGHVRVWGLDDCEPTAVLSVLCAGPAAEAESESCNSFRLYAEDLRLAVEQAARVCGKDSDRTMRLITEAKAGARQLVVSNWDAIRETATKLIERKWVCQKDVEAVVRRHARGTGR